VCGRFTSTTSVTDLASVFEVEEVRAPEMPPRYNVAPTSPVYAVALARGDEDKGPRRALGTFRWGLVPSWARDPSVGNRMINARAEGISKKPAYRNALARRRCLVPADAFYEWKKRPAGGKLPYAVRRRDRQPMALAGIWEVWRDRDRPDEPPLRSCAIVTTEANELMAPIHDRMPVVLERAEWERWLDPATDLSEVEALLRPAAPDLFEAFPVSTAVNNVANDGPELLVPDLPPGAGGRAVS